jgi:hypothetical protein
VTNRVYEDDVGVTVELLQNEAVAPSPFKAGEMSGSCTCTRRRDSGSGF